MKKFMKRLIPFLLVVLIIASLFWYCFVYDRNFARDMLLRQARFFSTNGNQKIASWFYDAAYSHSGQDEGVAIELANQFKSEGNYTKAEVTLSAAIADGGTACGNDKYRRIPSKQCLNHCQIYAQCKCARNHCDN